jgi:acyl carrier protein
MNKEAKLLEIVAEVLEVDNVTLETELNEDNWDSLAIVTFISEADTSFDLILSPESVGEVKNVAELAALI